MTNIINQLNISMGHQSGFCISQPPMRYMDIAAIALGSMKQVDTPDLLSNSFREQVSIITKISVTIRLL